MDVSITVAFYQAAYRAGGQNVTGRMIKGLYGKGAGAIGFICLHTCVGDAAAHLKQTVKAAPKLPWSAPAIGVQGNIDQAGIKGASRLASKSQMIKCVRAITMNQNIRLSQKRAKQVPIMIFVQIKSCAPFAQGHIGEG